VTGRAAVATVIDAECQGCGGCLLTCPEHAIRPAAGGGLEVLAPRCTGCGDCAEICPADAIVIQEVSVD
jgi:Pyruvate/2-oxoacid:ferredoxin oxidoreductase delta subunit